MVLEMLLTRCLDLALEPWSLLRTQLRKAQAGKCQRRIFVPRVLSLLFLLNTYRILQRSCEPLELQESIRLVFPHLIQH